MRILLATETFIPRVSGVTTHIDRVAQGLTARGHVVAVIAPSPNHKAYTEKLHGYEVFRIPSVKSPWQRNNRVAIQQYPLVVDAVRTFKPDIAHLHTALGVPSSVLSCARWQGFPVVASHHFSIEFVLRYMKPLALLRPVTKRVLISYLNRVYKKCAMVPCPTESFKEVLISFGIKAPLTVVSNGVNAEKMKPGTWPRKNQLLYVGRLAQEKNLGLLAEAGRLVLSKNPETKLVICGDGNLRRWLERELEEVAGQVTFTGTLEPTSAALEGYYKSSTAMLSTSLVETQGLTVLEASAYGTPVVAANGGSLPEIIINGKTGHLVDPEAVEKYVQKLTYLLTHSDKAESIGNAARELVSKDHSFEQTINKLESIYESVRTTYTAN